MVAVNTCVCLDLVEQRHAAVPRDTHLIVMGEIAVSIPAESCTVIVVVYHTIKFFPKCSALVALSYINLQTFSLEHIAVFADFKFLCIQTLSLLKHL